MEENYDIDEEDLQTIERTARCINNWITDVYWSLRLVEEQEEIKIEIIDIFGEKNLDSRIRFQDPSKIYKRKRGVNENNFKDFCKSLLEKIASIEKENEKISLLSDVATFLGRFARRSSLAKIGEYKELLEKYTGELRIPSINELERLSPKTLNSLDLELTKFAYSRYVPGEDIRIDGLSALSDFKVSQSGILVPAFSPIETYLTNTGREFREELRKYSS